MHADLTEVVTEARFHEGARSGVERLAGGAKYFIHDSRHSAEVSRPSFISSFALKGFHVLAVAARAAAGALALQQGSVE